MANTYTKVTRNQIASYLNVTPSAETFSWQILGVGVTDYSINFNPQNTTEKWIINKNATTSLDSYQIAGDVSQKCYKGDPVFDYVNSLRRKATIGSANETQVLDIDLYDFDSSSSTYKATLYDCTVSISTYGGSDDAVIEYNIAYNGDPKVGTVVITSGVPVFTEDTSI